MEVLDTSVLEMQPLPIVQARKLLLEILIFWGAVARELVEFARKLIAKKK